MPLQELRQRLADLDATISYHESILQELKQQRFSILSELNAVVYPVLTLPPEIMAQIFLWCIDVERCSHPSVAPLLLTQICRDWRALAFCTPELWDTISEIEFDLDRRAETVVETWFSRAGTRPLSLGIIYPENLESARLESVILKHASRLQSLDVMTSSEIFSGFVGIQPFPMLNNLELTYLEGLYDDLDAGDIQLFGSDGAPSLRHLSLETVPPSALIMPWAQLTKMTFTLISLSECLNALRWATSLFEFYRHGPEFDGQSGSEQLSVRHSSLNILSVSTSNGDEDVLQFLVLPALQKFELGDRFTIYARDMDTDIVPFLSRISGTLRTFHVGMSPTVPVHWFQPLTQLTTLELVRSMGLPFKTDVIRALDRRISPDFLPQLQSFVFSDCGSDQVDQELLDALASRCDARDAAHAKLESFSLIWPEFDYSLNDPFVRLPLVNVLPLRALAARGMRIHIGTPDQNSFY
ncbi:hypothetical protein B0H12DRAFT_1237051 [Mycena haematopus]|nr:hypothetical protein B0H12DRAFT_1237051 [Mycena haematopus]